MNDSSSTWQAHDFAGTDVGQAGMLYAYVQEMLGGRFRLLEILAQDGVELIFEALDSASGRRVSLQTIAVDPAIAPEALARLGREIRIARALQHPGIASIHAVEECEAPRYYTIDLARGTTLESIMRSGARLSFDAAISILASVALALDHAHQRGIVHGDLQPARIIVGAGRGVRALVSGFSHVANESLHGAGAAPPEGSPAYRAPEQWRAGESIDGRADQYALAIIAYELLTRTRRLDAGTTRGIQAIHPIEVPAHLPLAADVPLTANAALRRALAKKPAQRFPTVAEFIDALAERTHTPRSLPTVEPEPTISRGGSLLLPISIAFGVVAIALSLGAPGGRDRWVSAWQSAGEWIGRLASGETRRVAVRLPSASELGVTVDGRSSGSGSTGGRGVPAGGAPAALLRPQPSGGLTAPPTPAATQSRGVSEGSASAPPVRPAPAAAQRGFVRVTVDRGAGAVLVNGSPRGFTPWVGSLEPGPHTISVRGVRGRYSPAEIRVSVVAGDTLAAQFNRQ